MLTASFVTHVRKGLIIYFFSYKETRSIWQLCDKWVDV